MLDTDFFDHFTAAVADKRIGLIGDFCVDIYWHADMTKSELSRETPHYPLPVTDEKMSMGAAGNVAANIAALRPNRIKAISVYGNDWRGKMLLELLKDNNIDSSLFVCCPDRFTNAYCKPMRKGISDLVYEDARLDFDNYQPISSETEAIIINNLKKLAVNIDVLLVSDQFRFGVVTDNVRDEIIKLASSGLTVICDSRYNIGKYTNCILKPNEVECWRSVYGDEGYINARTEQIVNAAQLLAINNKSTVFCTLGAKGACITDGHFTEMIPCKKIDGPLDICGAGDTSLSAFGCALATGIDIIAAAEFAGLASGVTIQKIGQTGTASIDEIKDLNNK